MSTFDQDILFGQQAEDRIGDLLSYAGAFVKKKSSMCRYDFECVWCQETHRVEVKNEDKQVHTGNVCIETHQGYNGRFRPSGIAISESTICIHSLCRYCVLYRRSDMYQWLREQMQVFGSEDLQSRYRKEQNMLRWAKTGDNNNHSFIVPIEEMLSFDWFDYLPVHQISESKLWSY